MKLIARTLNVAVHQRGTSLWIEPTDAHDADPELAERVIGELYRLIEAGHALHPADVQHAVQILKADPCADLRTYFEDAILNRVDHRPITARTTGQRRYVACLREHDIVFGVGPAGTGKTYLAMAFAVAALRKSEVKRIVLTRPAVEAGEKLGFLPGDLTEKVDPYLRPLYDALADMIPQERAMRLIERRVIEVAPLAFMRGRTLDDAYVVLDEAQNTTREQMKMFLTRLGARSRMVITGDVTQIDLPRTVRSGMVEALRILEPIGRVGIARLTERDVVRHPLVAEIIGAYDAARRRELEDER